MILDVLELTRLVLSSESPAPASWMLGLKMYTPTLGCLLPF